MEKARRWIRACLVCVVLTAVVVGMIYYFGEVRGTGDTTEGTLIMQSCSGRIMENGFLQ